MNCPHCGVNAPVVKSRCTGCGQLVGVRPDVATAVLTPPPATDSLAAIDPDVTFAGGDVTRPPGSLGDLDLTGFNTPRPAHATDRTIAPTDRTIAPDFFKTPVPEDDMTRPPDGNRPSLSAGPLAIGQKFGARYRIVRLLGIGGMGAVYQAWDHELDVVVALKVIRPEASADPSEIEAIERRFKQELLLARQVTHTNVVRIHDLGEIDGIKYITMSYIQGADLATVLQRGGKMTVPAALALTREIASGLLAAHEAGVVHRDLKPPNIMIEGDHAVIMDFGIARSSGGAQGPVTPPGLPSRAEARAMAQTMAGAIVGTISYMAPEQAKGEPVDQRADMYAFGMIISDMLLGIARRGAGFNAIDDLHRRMTARPESLRKTDPSIPEALDKIVTRLLEPDPAARFQTTAELMAALNRLDENGVPLPLIRRLTPRLIATAAVVVIALLAGTFYLKRQPAPLPIQHEPLSVLIADFQNNTADAAFNTVLEPTLKRALEGAGFINAFDRIRLKAVAGVDAPGKLDEAAARDIAVKQGFGLVLAGMVAPQGSGFNLSLKAIQAETGNVIATVDRNAADTNDVLAAVTRLAAAARTALGDEAPESDQIATMSSLATAPLDVVREYVAGTEASANGRAEEARQKFVTVLERDPKFGIAYASLAAALRDLGRSAEAERYLQESLRHLDDMTERERLSTRAYFYSATGDYQQCVKEYGALLARFAVDVMGHRERAACMTRARDMRGAVDEMREVVSLVPNQVLFRDTLAVDANYAGDFSSAEEEARKLPAQSERALVALAMAQVGQNHVADAVATYGKLRALSPLGASLAASGLADIANVQGRFGDAVRILEQGAAADLAAKNVELAAKKLAALAYAELSRGRRTAAITAAEKALAAGTSLNVRFRAARSLVEAGAEASARPVIDGLAGEPLLESQVHAQILEGLLALKKGNARDAIKSLSAANTRLDTWIGNFELGRAYLAAGVYVQADSANDRSLKRRGEALALFVDEEPTFGYFPAAFYYQGQIRDALKNPGAAESYKAYLEFRGQSKEDPLLSDVRKRAGS